MSNKVRLPKGLPTFSLGSPEFGLTPFAVMELRYDVLWGGVAKLRPPEYTKHKKPGLVSQNQERRCFCINGVLVV